MFIPAHQVIGVMVNKDMDDSTKEEKEKVQRNLKAKTSLLPLLVLMSFF